MHDFMFFFALFYTKKYILWLKSMSESLFWPANGVRSTRLLVEIPNKWYSYFYNFLNISMMLNKTIIQCYWVDVITSSLKKHLFYQKNWQKNFRFKQGWILRTKCIFLCKKQRKNAFFVVLTFPPRPGLFWQTVIN